MPTSEVGHRIPLLLFVGQSKAAPESRFDAHDVGGSLRARSGSAAINDLAYSYALSRFGTGKRRGRGESSDRQFVQEVSRSRLETHRASGGGSSWRRVECNRVQQSGTPSRCSVLLWRSLRGKRIDRS